MSQYLFVIVIFPLGISIPFGSKPYCYSLNYSWVEKEWTVCPTVQPKLQKNLTYNRGLNSLGHLCNLMNYLCFTTKVWKIHYFPLKSTLLPLLIQYNVENWTKKEVEVFNIVWGLEARLGSCIRVWHVSKSPKSANLLQDFYPWL